MNRNALVFSSIALLAACATTTGTTAPEPAAAPKKAEPPLEPVPSEAISVPSRLDHDLLLARARTRLLANHFVFEAPLRPGFPQTPYVRQLALAQTRIVPDPTAEAPKCVGTAEIIQVETGVVDGRSMLRMVCYSDELKPASEPGGACGHHLVAGCGQEGDKLVGDIAMDTAQDQ